MNDSHVAGTQSARRSDRFDRHDLADSERVRTGLPSVLADWRISLVMHLQAIHADRGKSGHDADDAQRFALCDRHAGSTDATVAR